jgi:hypothetical protein
LGISRSSTGLWHATIEHHEREFPVDAPLALFEVTEPGLRPDWRLRLERGEVVAVGPSELEDQFFVDDVQERRDDALQRYRAMKARLGVSEPHRRPR